MLFRSIYSDTAERGEASVEKTATINPVTQTGTAAGPFSDSVTATGPITVTGTVAAPFTTTGTATGPFTRMTKTTTLAGSNVIELANYLDVKDMVGKPVSGVGIPAATTVTAAGGSGVAVGCTAYAGVNTLAVVAASSIAGVKVGQVVTGYGIPTATMVTAVDTATDLITLSAKTTAAIGTFDVNTVGVALGPVTGLTGTSDSFGTYAQQTTAGAPTAAGTKTVAMSGNVVVKKGMTVSSGTVGELETWTTVAEDSTGATVKLSDAVKVQMAANTQLTFSTKQVVLSGVTDVKVGQVVTGTGVDTSGGPAGSGGGTRVVSIAGDVITLDKSLTATLSGGALTFSTFTIELEHDADLIGVRITGSSTQTVAGTGIAAGTTVTQVNGKVIRLSLALEAGGNGGEIGRAHV